MMIRRLALLLSIALAAPAAAQDFVPADSALIANHALTEAEIGRVVALAERADSVFRAAPDAFAGIHSKEDGPYTIDGIAVRYGSNAAFRAELERAGITAREFVLTMAAIVSALRASMEESERRDALPPVEAANLRLVQALDEPITRMFATLRRVIPG
ncbi:hypothetical protein [Longimicrobium terrae]|uniref:Uncharacterized protein n=1 Tax=Longimicrobium terrae TaxID=1639882 RepID=A0A841H7F1_9BACT|nr:hypothetical protein [Longimicrobium terrae]MBB4639655.1 hypothetical protein [Longimicrobium terrae]MBB6074060.1 hypothetical protein [Longimicrobium terrae]NNC32655.1 hypothetical protein [Longimicrobium terrae]